MPHSFSRMLRISDQIQRTISDLLIRKAADPRFHGVSITSVRVSPDMSQADIFITLLETSNQKETLTSLNKAAGFFRSELAHILNLRITPKLRFIYDNTIYKGDQLSHLIDNFFQTKKEETPGE